MSKNLILYYFSPNCRWCLRNSPNLNALANAVGDNYQIISYSSDLRGLSDYVAKTGHHVQVATDDSVDIQKLLKLKGTPQTIAFDSRGVVVSNWHGAYSGHTLSEVEQYFNVSLPGLLESVKN